MEEQGLGLCELFQDRAAVEEEGRGAFALMSFQKFDIIFSYACTLSKLVLVFLCMQFINNSYLFASRSHKSSLSHK